MASPSLTKLHQTLAPLHELSQALLLHLKALENPDESPLLSSQEATHLAEMFHCDISVANSLVTDILSVSGETSDDLQSSPMCSPIRTVSVTAQNEEIQQLRKQIEVLSQNEQKAQLQIELLASKCSVQEDQIHTLTGRLQMALEQAKALDTLNLSTNSGSPRGTLRAVYAVLERTHEETGILEQRHKEEIAVLLNDADRRIVELSKAAQKREEVLVHEISKLDLKIRDLEEKIATLRDEKSEIRKELQAERRKRDLIINEKEAGYRTTIKTLERANAELALENERILVGRGSRLLHTYRSTSVGTPPGTPRTPRR
ncbi:hypothetical protein RCL1_003956 [Eukaryota sp. TZLM3-RCL]